MNAHARMTAYALTAALLASSAGATEVRRAPDLAIDLELTAARTGQSVFLVEARMLMGFELSGELVYEVNGVKAHREPFDSAGGRAMDVQGLDIREAASVCVRLQGRISLGGDLGRDVLEEECIVYLPSDQPLRSDSLAPDLVRDQTARQGNPHPLPQRR